MSIFNHERVILKVRRHPVTFLLHILMFLALLAFPSLFSLTTKLIEYPLPTGDAIQVIVKLFGTVYYAYVLLFILYSFFDYFLDIWIVTDKHVIDIEQKALFFRVISKQEVSRIQDVTAEIKGVMPTLFNYGDVHLQTAGAQGRFIFRKVPDPYGIVAQILKTIEANRKRSASSAP
ncbi:PH domain-containing protein [Candidatus Uhrbacteria bacterium]|nr:PH domain-containing protein [Candidatus Uhrbacteria bacterium]